MCPIYKITKFGPTWCKPVSNVMTNKFWIEVLQTWPNFCDKIPLKTENDVLSSPIWYNSNISNEKLFFPTWFKKGVECVGDVIDSNCNCLEQKYNIKQFIFLETYRLKWLIKIIYIGSKILNYLLILNDLKYLGVSFIHYLTRKMQKVSIIFLLQSQEICMFTLTKKWKNELYN